MQNFTFPFYQQPNPQFLKFTDIDFLLSSNEGRLLLLTKMNGLILYPEAESILKYIASKLEDFEDELFVRELQAYIDSLYKTNIN